MTVLQKGKSYKIGNSSVTVTATPDPTRIRRVVSSKGEAICFTDTLEYLRRCAEADYSVPLSHNRYNDGYQGANDDFSPIEKAWVRYEGKYFDDSDESFYPC